MIKLTEKCRSTLKKMTAIAEDYIKHYKTDFTTFDIPALVQEYDKQLSTRRSEDMCVSGYWFVRDTGTHLLIDSGMTDSEVDYWFNLYSSYNDKIFFFILNEDIFLEIPNAATRV